MLSQSYSNIELIIVNDCSTDNTKEILEYYQQKDSRVLVVNNEVNLKLPSSLNEGFKRATGTYYSWTSDDNQYHREAIKTMVDALEKNREYDLVYCDHNIVDINGTFISASCKQEPDFLKYVNCIGACFLYRKSIAEKVGEYKKEYFLAEDYEYWLRIYLNGKMKHIPQILYDYSIHESSLTATRQKDIIKKTYEVKRKYYSQLLERCGTQTEIDDFYWQMLSLLEDQKEKKEVKKQYYKENRIFALHDIQRNISNGCRYPFILFRACIKKLVAKCSGYALI